MDACAKSLEMALTKQIDPAEFKSLAQEQLAATKMAAQTKAEQAVSRGQIEKRRLEIDEQRFGQDQTLFKFAKIEQAGKTLEKLRALAEKGSDRMKEAADKLETEIEMMMNDACNSG